MNFRLLYFSVLIFSYYLIAPINFLLQSQGPYVSFGLRMIILFVGAGIIIRYKLTKISLVSLSVILFVVCINLLLFFNLYIMEYPTNDPKDGFYLYHLLIVIPSCIIIALLKYEKKDTFIILKKMSYFFLVVAVLNTICGILELIGNPSLLLSGRFQHSYLNPISMGFLFATGLITWSLLSLIEKNINLKSSLVMLFMLIGVIASNSRSALIGVILSFIYIMVYEIVRNRNFKLLFLTSLISGVGLLFSIFYLNINPLGRISSITSKTETSVTSRIEVWTDSFNIIANSPIFPGRLVTNHGGFPHNIFVELTTGFGIPLSIMFLMFILAPLLRIPRDRTLLTYGAIYILYFMRASTSGGLFQLSEMFSLIIVIFCIYKLRISDGVNSGSRTGS